MQYEYSEADASTIKKQAGQSGIDGNIHRRDILALALSCYSTWKTLQFNTKQEQLIESQRQLNALLADKEASELAESKRAKLSAAFMKLGSSKYRLKVFNQAQATARDVRISFPAGSEVVLQSEIDAKFPLETLDGLPHHKLAVSQGPLCHHLGILSLSS